MELSEAKEILKDMKEDMEQSKKDITIDSILKALEDSVKAIDTVLKALDNSISKDEVRKLSNDAFEVNTHEYGTLFVVPYDNIQELLGE